MRLRTSTPILILLTAVVAVAQTVVPPGQLATAMPPSSGNGSLLLQPPPPASRLVAVPDRHNTTMNRLWMVSLAAIAAGSSADAATSWGKREGNGFLASSNGTFGGKAVSIKAGMAAASMVPQIILRNHTSLRKKFIIANFIGAGAFAGASIHNSSVSAPNQ